MNNYSSKVILLISIIIIIGLAISLGLYFYFQEGIQPEALNGPNERKDAPNQQLNLIPADWLTYRNNEHKFEISYPPDWKFNDKGIFEFTVDNNNPAIFEIQTFQISTQELEEPVSQHNPFRRFDKFDKGRYIDAEDILIAGEHGRLTWNFVSEQGDNDLFIANFFSMKLVKRGIYTLQLRIGGLVKDIDDYYPFLEKNDPTRQLHPRIFNNDLQLVKKVVSTLRFIE